MAKNQRKSFAPNCKNYSDYLEFSIFEGLSILALVPKCMQHVD